MIARDVCADVLLGLAVLTVASASLGVLLMRDAYDKLHFVTPAALVAPVLVALAVLVQMGLYENAGETCLALLAMVIADIPVARHHARHPGPRAGGLAPVSTLAVQTAYTVPTAMMEALQITLLVLVAAGATAVVLIRAGVRQVLMLSIYGVLLAVLFLAFQAPDVTLSELVVGGGAARHPAPDPGQGQEARAMTPRQRRWIFLIAGAGLVAFYLWGLSGLPGFGNYPDRTGCGPARRRRADQRHRRGVRDQLRLPRLRHRGRGVHFVRRRGRGRDRAAPAAPRTGRPAVDEAAGRDVPATSSAVRMVALLFPGPWSWPAGGWPRTRRPTRPAASRAGSCWPPRSS